MSTTTQGTSIGMEVMRVDFSGKQEVKEMKIKFAELFDYLSTLAMEAEKESDTTPAITSTETITRHMEVIRKNQEAIRCYAEACRIIETACMYAVKGLTA